MVGRKFDSFPDEACFYRELGRFLVATRQKYGLSQKDVAAVIGLSFQQIQKYETAANRVTVYVLYKLARAYGVSFANIFGLDLTECDYRILDAARTKELLQETRAKLDELQEFLTNANR